MCVCAPRGIFSLPTKPPVFPIVPAQSSLVSRHTSVFHSGGNVTEWMTAAMDRMNRQIVVHMSVGSLSCSSARFQTRRPLTAFPLSRFATEPFTVTIRRTNRTVRRTRVLSRSSSAKDPIRDVFLRPWFATGVRTVQTALMKRAAQCMCVRGTSLSAITNTVSRMSGAVTEMMTVAIGRTRKGRVPTALPLRVPTAT